MTRCKTECTITLCQEPKFLSAGMLTGLQYILSGVNPERKGLSETSLMPGARADGGKAAIAVV